MRIMLTCIFGAFMIACIGAIGFRILYSVNGYGKQPINLRTDTIPVYKSAYHFQNMHSIGVDSDLVRYDVYISSIKSGRVAAYKKRDSAWVILDSAETFKQLLFIMEQQAKKYK